MPLFSSYKKRLTDLQEQVTSTGRELLARSRNWRRLSTKPPSNCDVVVVFDRNASPSKITWLADVLRERIPELIVTETRHTRTRRLAFYLSCSYKNLLKGAQEVRMKKRLTSKYRSDLQEFCIEDMDCFEGVEDEDTFLSSSERQTIVNNYLMSLRAEADDFWNETVTFATGQAIIPVLLSAKVIKSVFPLHDRPSLTMLMETWVQGFTHQQPIDAVEQYFGIRIALYFAWLGHYTFSLLMPAIFGIFCWLILPTDKSAVLYFPVTALCTMVWVSIFLETWKRKNSDYTNRWGTLDKQPNLLMEPRPLFLGELKTSPITGRLERFYPRWKRNITICFFTVPIVFICLIFIIVVAIAHIKLQEYTEAKTAKWTFFGAKLIPFLPMILHAVNIALLYEIYYKIAVWLTDKENHRLQDEFSNALVAKLIYFQFVNSFFASFYIAFYQMDLQLLRQHLIAMLVTRQIIGNIKEIFLPYGQTKLQQVWLTLRSDGFPKLTKRADEEGTQTQDEYRRSTTPDSISPGISERGMGRCSPSPTIVKDTRRRKLEHQNEPGQCTTPLEHYSHDTCQSEGYIPRAEQEEILPTYDDPSDDYLEMFIQFGFVSMFTCAFPICGLLAFLNNILEIRSDAFKLVANFQRPFTQSVANIGVWGRAFYLLSYVAISVNVGLIWVSGSLEELCPGLQQNQRLMLLIVLEHLLYYLHYALSHIVPPIPLALEENIAILEHKRREALRKLERESRREAKRIDEERPDCSQPDSDIDD